MSKRSAPSQEAKGDRVSGVETKEKGADGPSEIKRAKLSVDSSDVDEGVADDKKAGEPAASKAEKDNAPPAPAIASTGGFGGFGNKAGTSKAGGLFASLSSNPFGAGNSSDSNSGKKGNTGGSVFGSSGFGSIGKTFGAVVKSKTTSIFATVEGAFSSTPSSGKSGTSPSTATAAAKKSVFGSGPASPAFGSDGAKKATNDIFSNKNIETFGASKAVARAQSPGLERIEITTGEEDEDNLVSFRCKLFKMEKADVPATGENDAGDEKANDEKSESTTPKKDGESSSSSAKKASPEEEMIWKMKGVGELRLNETKKSDRSGKPRRQRLIMRREYGSGSTCGDVILNIALTQDVLCSKENEKHLRLVAFEHSGAAGDAQPSTSLYLIRIKRLKHLDDLLRRVTNHVKALKRDAENFSS